MQYAKYMQGVTQPTSGKIELNIRKLGKLRKLRKVEF